MQILVSTFEYVGKHLLCPPSNTVCALRYGPKRLIDKFSPQLQLLEMVEILTLLSALSPPKFSL